MRLSRFYSYTGALYRFRVYKRTSGWIARVYTKFDNHTGGTKMREKFIRYFAQRHPGMRYDTVTFRDEFQVWATGYVDGLNDAFDDLTAKRTNRVDQSISESQAAVDRVL